MPDNNSLSQYFRQLKDPRIERGKFHTLHDVLIIAVCALLCGAEGFVDMEEFGKAQHEWIKKLLALPKGIPSHDTFGRVFAALDPAQFAEAFTAWTQSLRETLAGEIVAVDGKPLRRSGSAEQSRVPLVSTSTAPARTGHAATDLATLRHIALNLPRKDTTKKRGIRTKQKIAAWDHRYLIKLLSI